MAHPLTIEAGGSGPAGRAIAGKSVDQVAAGGAVEAGRAGAVVYVLVAERAGPAGVAGASEAPRRRGQRANAMRARLRRARVVHSLAIHAGKALGARA